MAVVSTWGSSPCSQLLGVMVSPNCFLAQQSLPDFQLEQGEELSAELRISASRESARQNHPCLLDPPDPTVGSGLQHGAVRDAGGPAQKKAVALLSPISLVLVLLPNASADLPFLFALMLGPGLKNINISLSADAASIWEGVWEAWETGGGLALPRGSPAPALLSPRWGNRG